MDCENVRAKFPEYVSGELDFGEKRCIAGHLARCYYCNEALRDLEECLEVSRSILKCPAPSARFDKLVAAIQQPEDSSASEQFWRAQKARTLAGPLAAFAAAMVVVSGMLFSVFTYGAWAASEPLHNRAELNDRPELGNPVTTVAWDVYLFRSNR